MKQQLERPAICTEAPVKKQIKHRYLFFILKEFLICRLIPLQFSQGQRKCEEMLAKKLEAEGSLCKSVLIIMRD